MMTIISTVFSQLTKLIPDKNKQAELQLEYAKLAANGSLKELEAEVTLAVNQLAVNVEEAKNSNLFVSGWRPGVGWVCAICVGCFYLPQYLFGTAFWVHDMYVLGHVIPFPLDTNGLMELMTGMLGIAGLRTYEKFKGVSK